jgi:hypothetical protein
MRGLISSVAVASALFVGAVCAGQALAQQRTVAFACVVAKGHVCQFVVQTQAGPIQFALPAGAKKRMAVTPEVDTYCVCDPGPVTPDCKEPTVGKWCLGSWARVRAGVNSGDLGLSTRFASE